MNKAVDHRDFRSGEASDVPRVSVVMPTRNRPPLLRRAISSVLRQTFEDFELIVVDDASDDETGEVVASFDDDRVRYVRHEVRRHASAARNTGIQRSAGEFVAFLDDDDTWLPTKLAKQVRMLEDAPPDVGLVYCWMDLFGSQGELVNEVHPILRGRIFGQVLDRPRIGGCPTLLVRREVFDTVGLFDEELLRGNDGDFIRRTCLKYSVDVVPEVLVEVDVGHGGERISQLDERGIRAAIKGHSVKLTKFAGQLPDYPVQAAAIYANIGYHHSQLGEWSRSFGAYAKALRTAPLSANVYLTIMRGVRARLLYRRPD